MAAAQAAVVEIKPERMAVLVVVDVENQHQLLVDLVIEKQELQHQHQDKVIVEDLADHHHIELAEAVAELVVLELLDHPTVLVVLVLHILLVELLQPMLAVVVEQMKIMELVVLVVLAVVVLVADILLEHPLDLEHLVLLTPAVAEATVPDASGGLVFVGSRDTVMALEATGGQPRWTRTLPGPAAVCWREPVSVCKLPTTDYRVCQNTLR